MRESVYQAHLIKRLKNRFPGCVVMKNDCNYIQGLPDLTILYRGQWAVLEVKASEDAPEQPNQRYYIDMMNDMSFAAFICPENEEEVMGALQRSLEAPRPARVSEP